MLVNILLKDGTELKNCSIYQEGVRQGDSSITSTEEIESLFSKIPWGRKHISFQNELINGHVHVNDVENYSFVNR